MNRIFRNVITSVCALVVLCVTPATADVVFFNSSEPANNVTTRNDWLAAVGITTPQHLVDFETGFTSGQNISGITGLFPAGLVITDTGSNGMAQIISGAGSISNSNPVGVFSLRQNEEPYLELDFSNSPIDYFGFQDIDHVKTDVVITYLGGATSQYELDSARGSGDTAEFLGIYLNDMPRIVKLQFDADGDTWWGVDTIEYGILLDLPGDLDGDGFVGIADLNIVLGAWNQNVPPGNSLADPSGDGFVGIEDLNTVLGNWNAGTPPNDSANIPEPAAITTLLAGILLLHRRSA